MTRRCVSLHQNRCSSCMGAAIWISSSVGSYLYKLCWARVRDMRPTWISSLSKMCEVWDHSGMKRKSLYVPINFKDGGGREQDWVVGDVDNSLFPCGKGQNNYDANGKWHLCSILGTHYLICFVCPLLSCTFATIRHVHRSFFTFSFSYFQSRQVSKDFLRLISVMIQSGNWIELLKIGAGSTWRPEMF